MISVLTREAMRGWTWRQTMFGDLKNGGYLHTFICNENPRLEKVIRTETRASRPVVTILVDGRECRDLDEAVERLNQPPAPKRRPRVEQLPLNLAPTTKREV